MIVTMLSAPIFTKAVGRNLDDSRADCAKTPAIG
jgi:hypothetical protein